MTPGGRVMSAEQSLDESRQHVVLAVAEAYFGVVRQRRLVDSCGRTLARARKLRDASEARTTAGLATRLDVLRADLLVSQSKAQLETQRELLAAGLDRLKVLVGRPLTSDIHVAGDDLPLHVEGGLQPAHAPPVEALLASALERAEQTWKRAEEQARLAALRLDTLEKYGRPAAVGRANAEVHAARQTLARHTDAVQARLAERQAVTALAAARVAEIEALGIDNVFIRAVAQPA